MSSHCGIVVLLNSHVSIENLIRGQAYYDAIGTMISKKIKYSLLFLLHYFLAGSNISNESRRCVCGGGFYYSKT